VEITIFRGNWDAWALANYLTSELSSESISVYYDEGALGFIFYPSIDIVASGTTCGKELGLGYDFEDGNYTKSIVPIQLSGPYVINVDTSLSINNFPISGRLACVPLNCNFGECLLYTDVDGGQPSLCMDHDLKTITITLVDQDGKDLDEYLDSENDHVIPNWQVCISIQPEPNNSYTDPGFISQNSG